MTEKFHYTFNEQQITLPHAKNIKMGLIRKTRKLPPGDQEFTLLEALLGDEALEVVDQMDAEEFEKFLQEWQDASGVDLGESGASSTS